MRIISGSHKGRQITAPSNLPVHPTTDFAKTALFNILNSYINVEDLSVLDLFAGTGNISYEFASRGSKSVTAVDIESKCTSFIISTSEKLNFINIRVIKNDVFNYLDRETGHFDLIFADPPFDMPQLPGIPGLVLRGEALVPGGLFILEHPKRYDFSEFPGFEQHRNYGEVNFSFFRKTEK